MSTKQGSKAGAPPIKKLSQDILGDAQQDLMVEVQYVLEAVLRDKGVTRREIASRLGKSEATISRALDGDSNLTLKTIADIATALGDRFQVSSSHFEKMKSARKVSSMYSHESASWIDVGDAWGQIRDNMIIGVAATGVELSRPAGVEVVTVGSAFVDVGVGHHLHLMNQGPHRRYVPDTLPRRPIEKEVELV